MRGFIIIKLLYITVGILCGVCADQNIWFADPIVKTKNGQVLGKITTTLNGKKMYAFQGIPYAQPPVGKLRFQAPLPVKNWNGTLNATSDGNACIGNAFVNSSIGQSEDCLFLNIYSPEIDEKKKYPVMVYIHGGHFAYGSGGFSNYDPSFFVEQDVIVVTMNYRLGPLGFFSTEDLIIPGNAGLKDQNRALKWTKNNIKAFGGDSSKVTIFGHSAGGRSCGLHVLSKMSAGLFRAAICQSSSALVPNAVYHSPKTHIHAVANLIDNSVTNESYNSKDLLAFLLNQTASDIIRASVLYGNTQENEAIYIGPWIETPHAGAFMTKSPYVIIQSGEFNKVPLMIGVTFMESALFFKTTDQLKQEGQKLDSQEGYILPYNFELANSSNKKDAEKYIRNFYLKNNKSFSENLIAAVKYRSDESYNRGTIKQAEMQSKYTDVFFYQYTYYGELNTKVLPEIAELQNKSFHSAELPYIWANDIKAKGGIITLQKRDVLTINRMSKLWTNFAKFLNPTPEKENIFQNLTWPKVTSNKFLYLDINDNLTIREDPKNDTYPGWNHVFYTWNKKPFITF